MVTTTYYEKGRSVRTSVLQQNVKMIHLHANLIPTAACAHSRLLNCSGPECLQHLTENLYHKYTFIIIYCSDKLFDLSANSAM